MTDELRGSGALTTALDSVATFQKRIIGLEAPGVPTVLKGLRADFREGHLEEELTELREAFREGDLDKAVDACVDLAYVAMGTIYEMGVMPYAAFQEVHRANMSKVRGERSKRPNALGFDAVKPADWRGPDFDQLLTLTQLDVETILAVRSGKLNVVFVPSSQRSVPEIPADCLYGFKDGDVVRYHGPGTRLLGLELRCYGPDPDYLGMVRIENPGVTQPATFRVWGSDLELVSPAKLVKPRPEPPKPKLLILGYARHGKDTVCELLRDRYGFSFTSSSLFCAERVMMPAFASASHIERHYTDAQDCFNDRHNHRGFWYDTIRDFNRPDATRLGRAVFEGHDLYCGLRSAAEFHALRNAGVFDLAIWVDRSEHQSREDASSCTVEPWMADFVLDNNGTLADLELNLGQLMSNILGREPAK